MTMGMFYSLVLVRSITVHHPDTIGGDGCRMILGYKSFNTFITSRLLVVIPTIWKAGPQLSQITLVLLNQASVTILVDSKAQSVANTIHDGILIETGKKKNVKASLFRVVWVAFFRLRERTFSGEIVAKAVVDPISTQYFHLVIWPFYSSICPRKEPNSKYQNQIQHHFTCINKYIIYFVCNVLIKYIKLT